MLSVTEEMRKNGGTSIKTRSAKRPVKFVSYIEGSLYRTPPLILLTQNYTKLYLFSMNAVYLTKMKVRFRDYPCLRLQGRLLFQRVARLQLKLLFKYLVLGKGTFNLFVESLNANCFWSLSLPSSLLPCFSCSNAHWQTACYKIFLLIQYPIVLCTLLSFRHHVDTLG